MQTPLHALPVLPSPGSSALPAPPSTAPKATSAPAEEQRLHPETGHGAAAFCFPCPSRSAPGHRWPQPRCTRAPAQRLLARAQPQRGRQPQQHTTRRLELPAAALPPPLLEAYRRSLALSGSGGPTRAVTAENQQRACVFYLCCPAWDKMDNTIDLSSSQLGDCWMTDITHGEHHCIIHTSHWRYKRVQKTQELPRKFEISNLHETNLQQLHFESRPGTCFDPKQKSATSDD